MVQTLAMRDAQRMDEQKRQKAIRHEQADPTENANAFWLKFKPEAQGARKLRNSEHYHFELYCSVQPCTAS